MSILSSQNLILSEVFGGDPNEISFNVWDPKSRQMRTVAFYSLFSITFFLKRNGKNNLVHTDPHHYYY